MGHIIFRNPDAKLRKENFGGIVKSGGYFYVIGPDEFEFLRKIKKKPYDSLNAKEKKITYKFISLNVLLKIEEAKAKRLISLVKNGKSIPKK